jgi:transcriptional regulator with XRE-family HTH domain
LKSVHSDQYAAFLAVIIAARNELGLSQRELAQLLQKPQSYVSKYERGERRLDIVEFLELSKILKLDPCAVLGQMERRHGEKEQ